MIEPDMKRTELENGAKKDPPSSKRSFAIVLEEVGESLEKPREEEEEEPLFDGPVSGFTPRTSSQPPTPLVREALPPSKGALEILASLKPAIEAMQTKGVLTTRIELNSRLLKDVVIDIEQYDTAPSAFNISFSGNLEAQKLFLAQKQALEIGLLKALPGMTFTLLPPTYPTKRQEKSPSLKNSLVKTRRFGYGANQKESMKNE